MVLPVFASNAKMFADEVHPTDLVVPLEELRQDPWALRADRVTDDPWMPVAGARN